jgi:hypothetical protein
MDHRTQLGLLSLPLAVATMSCFLMNLRPQMDVKDYQGDGTVSQVRSAESPGFKIDFPPFTLGAPYEASYRLDGIPERHAAIQYLAGLVVDLTEDEAALYPPRPASLASGDHGTLTMTLEDSSGTKLFQGEAKVAAFNWSAPGDLPLGHVSHWYYHQGDDSHPRNQPWFLLVAYSPGTDATDRSAHVRFVGGGWH